MECREIGSIAVHTGKDPYGQTFSKSMDNFEKTVLVPFSTFLHKVYREQKFIHVTKDINLKFQRPMFELDEHSFFLTKTWVILLWMKRQLRSRLWH